MTLRTQFEAVLQKHRTTCDDEWVLAEDSFGRQLPWCRTFLNDLLACIPTPSREKLEELFDYHNYRYASAEEWRTRFKEAMWTWATGQPAKTWCGHCVWDAANNEWVLTHSADLFEKDDAMCSRVIRSDRIDHPQWQF